MIPDPFYCFLKLRRLVRARYAVARHRGELTLSNALRAGMAVSFFLLSFSFGEVWSAPAGDGGEVTLGQTPRLIAGAPPPPSITAESAYVIDLASGFVFYDKNSARELPPASATKIATALVSLCHYNLDDVLVVPPACSFRARVGESLMGLFSGERITVRNLLRGMLIASGSDAACVLAARHSGGESGFVGEMNEVASMLGLERTHFVNPTGMDAASHYSTARELTVLARKALANPTFREIVRTEEDNVASADGRRWHRLETTNKLLETMPGILGVKTGYTARAKEVFVFYFVRNGHEFLGAVLGSDDRFGDAQVLINWILSSFFLP